MIRWTEPTTEVAEDVLPATQMPRDAKPSELIRGWPKSRWCIQRAKDDEGRFCAIGILAHQAGITWRDPSDAFLSFTGQAMYFVEGHYDIPLAVLDALMDANDLHGKNAAADYLESAGF